MYHLLICVYNCDFKERNGIEYYEKKNNCDRTFCFNAVGCCI